MKYELLLFLAIFSFAGCATKLTSGAEKIRIIKSDPSKSKCEELDVIEGFTGSGPKRARNILRNKAHELGGNLIRIDSQNKGEDIQATVFKCK